MKIPVLNFRLFQGKQSIMALALCGCLGLFGCSSSDDGGGDAAVDPTAFNFNANNATLAAEIAAAAIEFFPEYTGIAQQVLAILVNDDPNNSPFDMSASLCDAGNATLTWSDPDNSGDLSVGDSASLQFSNCVFDGDTASGTVDVAISSVAENLLDITVQHTVALNLTITLGAETTTVSASFSATVNTPDGGNNFTADYVAASGDTVTITENGVEYFKLGCFDVTMTFDGLNLEIGTFDISPSGVINASNQIMSLAGGSTIGVLTGLPHSGIQRLLSVAQPVCGDVGTPGGVADSDGSYMDMEMLGFGDLLLTTYDVNNNQTSSVNTTWNLLTD